MGSIRGRVIVITLMALLSIWTFFRNDGVKLGLDLRGGMHLALEVHDPDSTMTDEARRQAVDQVLYVLRNRIDQFGVGDPLVQKSGEYRIIVQLPGIDDEERAKEIINRQALLEWKLVLPSADLVTSALGRMDRLIAAELAARGDTAAVDTTIQRARDIAQLLAGDTTTRPDTTTASDTTRFADQKPLSQLIFPGGGGEGEFLVAEENVERVKQYLAIPGVLDALPRGAELRWGAKPISEGAQLYRQLYVLEAEPFLTGERLQDATASRDVQFQQPVVLFELDRRGGQTFDRVTGQHVGDRIAIVLDTLVHSAPVVRDRIGSRGEIQMGSGSSMQEASDLALVLRAGALPVGLNILEQRSVGPSLGRDSIDQGKVAGTIGILLVIAIMIVYYRLAGILAVAAMVFYVLFVFGALAGFGAALTAPGIAGLILSLGMAVDANVLIFERVREEIVQGRSTRAAVDAGFRHAMSAIVDSNLTTLITALILYQVGTGPVRGFAVTLAMGIIASFITAVYITRTFFLIYLQRKRASDPISI